MSDQNAPSWLTPDDPAPATTSAATPAQPAKSGGVFKMFSKENATAHVQKAAVTQATTQAQNIASAPDDGLTPAWATSKAYTPPNNIENGVSGAAAAPATVAVPEQLDIDPATLKKMRFYHWILRILYMIASSLMASSAGLSLILQNNVSKIFFAIYVLFFCLLIWCFELGLSLVSRNVAINFGFLYTLTGRFIFIVFVGVMSFSLSLFGQISMAIMFAVLLFHATLMFYFPKFSRYVRQKDLGGGK